MNMEAGTMRRRDSGNRPNTPGTSGVGTSVKKKAPAPPAPGQGRSPSVAPPPAPTKSSEVKEVKRPCAEHNFLTDVSVLFIMYMYIIWYFIYLIL